MSIVPEQDDGSTDAEENRGGNIQGDSSKNLKQEWRRILRACSVVENQPSSILKIDIFLVLTEMALEKAIKLCEEAIARVDKSLISEDKDEATLICQNKLAEKNRLVLRHSAMLEDLNKLRPCLALAHKNVDPILSGDIHLDSSTADFIEQRMLEEKRESILQSVHPPS